MPLLVVACATSNSTLLFRRKGSKPTRDDAFQDLFNALNALYEQTAELKPEWRTLWDERAHMPLPPKYDFGNPIATDAAQAMRFATALLQRYRWRSLVQPLFETYEEHTWHRVQQLAGAISADLVAIAESHAELLLADERDWIDAAVEQFDEATRRRLLANAEGLPAHRRVAEGTYQAVYLAIQLSDRLIERLRFEASQRD